MTNQSRNLMGIIVIIVIAVLAFGFLTMPDQRTDGQRIGDAIDALPQGLDKAAEKLERRTPGEKLGDAVEDAGQNIKESTDRN